MFRKMGLVDVLIRNEDKQILEQILAMLKKKIIHYPIGTKNKRLN